MSGTSMATPHAAGVAALILSIKPSLTAAQCADIMRLTADPLKDNPADPIPNDNYGWGCVNAFAAVNRASPPVSTAILCQPSKAILCPPKTTLIQCQQVSQQIVCQLTVPVTCPQSQLVVCQASQLVLCKTTPIICQVHTNPVICQVASGAITCVPSVSLGCQSIACNPGNPGEPGFQGGTMSSDDPYAPDYSDDPVE
jgi:hypothetical protein